MIGALKTIGTVLTVASTAQFGKEMYDKYKGKKKARQIDEVHAFIGALDLDALQRAIDSNDTDALVDAVEDIMVAAEAVKVKSDLEEFAEDAQEVAGKLFDKFTTVASKVADRVGEKLGEVKNAVDDMDDDDLDEFVNPSYKEFKKYGARVTVDSGGKTYSFTINDDNVYTSNKTKEVTFITEKNEVIITKLV